MSKKFYYAEEVDGIWYVFDNETGKAYSSWCDQKQAEFSAKMKNESSR